jgi:hypothetical protein
MRINSIIIYLGAPFFIFIGVLLSTISPMTAFLGLIFRIGHGFIIFGVTLILSKLSSFYLRYTHPKSFSSLLSQESGVFYWQMWMFKKERDKITITSNSISSYKGIIGTILGYSVVLYIFLPGINDIIRGLMDISFDTIVSLLIIVFTLSVIFVSIHLFLIFRRMRKLIDKSESIVHISKDLRKKTNQLSLGNNCFQINLPNLHNAEVAFNGIYQILVPLDGYKGNLTAFKNWIIDNKFILIQSHSEDFIREINAGIMEFIR